MISEKDTNKIYLSGLLESRFPRVFSEIISGLDNFGLKANPLPDTRDIWARDYMPIQISTDKFIEFRYDPDYLQGTDKGRRDLKTYPEMVCAKLGLKTEISDLILDGGNVVRSTNCIILTDKVVKENRHTYSKPELISKLQKTFEVDKVVLIPWDTLEKYGHADGMVRFIDNKTVLVNKNYKKNTVLIYRLESSGLKCKFLNYKVKKQNKNNWAYINFLQTKDLILLPKLGAEEDDHRIIQIEMNDIIALGGALNCISWTIKE